MQKSSAASFCVGNTALLSARSDLHLGGVDFAEPLAAVQALSLALKPPVWITLRKRIRHLYDRLRHRFLNWWEVNQDFVKVYAAFGLFALCYFAFFYSIWLEQTKQPPSIQFEEQLKQLSSAQTSLENLIKFIEQQRKKLNESESTVRSLSEEAQRLRPAVAADRKALEAVLQLQESRNRSTVIAERGIAFGLGVMSSLLASILWHFFSRKREPPQRT